ncbi:MAG: N-acetylmuramoyl-L-alanine amidase [Marinicellaceae bacterium]
MTNIVVSNQDNLLSNVQSILLPINPLQSDYLLPTGSSIKSVKLYNDEIVIILDLPQAFLNSSINEALLEKLSRILHINLDQISPISKKVHFAVEINGQQIALSNLLQTSKVPIKEGNYENQLKHKEPKKNGQINYPLFDKVLFISQAHGWIDYNSAAEWETQRGITHDIVEDFVNAEAINQYLLEYLTNAGAKVFTLRERDMNTNMVIVDDQDGGLFPSNGIYQEQGDSQLFSDSSANGFKNFQAPYSATNDPFRDNGGSDRVLTTTPTETARAIWKPVIPEDGYYHVYVSYSGIGDRPTDAQYIISHGGIETEVLVNQEVHRYVWNNIGQFYFKAGQSDFVALTNKSQENGTSVSADAIRIGGGMGDILGNYHPVISSHPRWEEGARPYVQFQGASPAVYASGDVGARSRFAAWEHYSGEDSVYVSWHSNAATGSARGTSSYIYSSNPPDGTFDETQSVEGSAALQAAIHDEIINDIRSDWQVDWLDRGYRSAYFGEINPNNNDEMPSVLLEMAFHDNANDADALRHPAFRKLAARAVYQGIVKYFANRDGLQTLLLPEPPTHIQVVSPEDGTLNVSWQAPIVDNNGVFGDAATSYLVYLSSDGYNFDNGSETMDLFYSFKNLEIGKVYYIKVKARNSGGLSLASETLGARIKYTNENRVLIINGFDRLSSGQLVYMNMPDVGGFVDRMFLNKMNTFNYSIQHGNAINDSGVGFDSIANELIEDELFNLDINTYIAVIWILGEESSAGKTLASAEQNQLQIYLNAGGKLFISGAEIAWDLDHLGSAIDKDFYNNVLMSQYISDDSGVFQADGTVNSIFSELTPIYFDDGSNGSYQVEFPDEISPTHNAESCMTYLGAQSACTYVDTGTYQVINLGFPFESIYPESMRNEIMSETMNYFSIPFFSDIIFQHDFESQ